MPWQYLYCSRGCPAHGIGTAWGHLLASPCLLPKALICHTSQAQPALCPALSSPSFNGSDPGLGSWAARACREVRKIYGSLQCGTARLTNMASAVHPLDAILQCCPSPPSPHGPGCSVPQDTQVLMMVHSRVPAAQLPRGAADKALVWHHMPILPCSFLGETVLPLGLGGKNEPHPKFSAKEKNEKLPHGCAKVLARDGLWAERAFLQGKALLRAGFLQLVKHLHPL